MRYQHNRLQQLRGFCHAARAGSISKAAERMSLSQPSVSLQIQALERDLNTQLFERRGPSIRLTRDGATLLELAGPLVDGFNRLVDDFEDLRDSVTRGSVKIAAGGSTLQYILPPFIESFAEQNPQIDLQLHNVTGKAGLNMLREGEADLAVGPMLDAPPDIIFEPLVTYDTMLITSPRHPLATKKRVGLRDIAKHPLILPPRTQSTFRFVEMVFSERSLDYEVKLEVGGYDVIKTYVKMGLGISIVMGHCLTPEDKLHTRSLRRFFPPRSYGLVLRRGRPLWPAPRLFVQSMCPNLRLPPLPGGGE